MLLARRAAPSVLRRNLYSFREAQQPRVKGFHAARIPGSFLQRVATCLSQLTPPLHLCARLDQHALATQHAELRVFRINGD